MAISFQNADTDFRLADRTALKKFIAASFEKEAGKTLSVTYVFCSDTYLLKVNNDFLKHDYYTDIITFPLAATAKKVAAEIYISIDRVTDNASKHKVSPREELHRVMFHGILHLIGYGDKTNKEKAIMRKKEEEWMLSFNATI